MKIPFRPVVIAGAGPVGMLAAADLVRQGIAVTVLEKNGALSMESRASTFHPPTLDMLDKLGFVQPLIAQGLKAPQVQYGSTLDGELGTFDFADIGDLTRHPYRLQAEQYKLTRIVLDALEGHPLFEIRFGCELTALAQDAEGVDLTIGGAGADTGGGTSGSQALRCSWLIGADGASSVVRRSQNVEFEGFTWPERFLVVTTSADIASMRPGIASVSYWADPQQWHFLLRIIGAWRVMVPVAADVPDELAQGREFAQRSLASVLPSSVSTPIEHVTLYRVHQRVATRFRNGRVFLAGDAAHINNPLGGMGMNGGLHDALNLSGRLGAVIRAEDGEQTLDAYDRQRRTVTMEAIQSGTIRNKSNLEARTLADREAFKAEICDAASDRTKARAFLRRISMIDSLERAATL